LLGKRRKKRWESAGKQRVVEVYIKGEREGVNGVKRGRDSKWGCGRQQLPNKRALV
jgi:hypothetical protein